MAINEIKPMPNGRISSSYFHYNKEDKTFSQEASSLPSNFNPTDGKIALVGQISGKSVDFELKETKLQEGDITCWVFKATLASIQKEPKAAAVTIIIWND